MLDRLDEMIDSKYSLLVSLAQTLIRVPSVSTEEGPAQELMAELMRAAGLSVDVWNPDPYDMKGHPAFELVDSRSLGTSPNVVGCWRGRADGRSLIINGHIDVVPAGEPGTWGDDPWAATMRDGKIHGRGSCDMKGNLAVALYVLQLLRETGYQPAGDIILQSVIGEETGGVGTLAAISRGYKADSAIVLEPTCLKIVPAHAGAATFRLTIFGRAAHGSMRERGVSPIEKFIRVHTALLDLEKRRNTGFSHPFFAGINNKIPLSIGTINSGVWHSSVPDKLIAEGRYGIRVGESIKEAQASLEECVRRACQRDNWLREHPVLIEWLPGQFESTLISEQAPILTLLKECISQSTGREATLQGVTYGSDMRLLVNYAQIPTVLFGAGDINVAHAADEFIEVKEMITMAKVLSRLIVNWCGTVE